MTGSRSRSLRWRVVAYAVAGAVLAAAPGAHATRNDPDCPGIRPGAVMWPEKEQYYETSWNFILSGSDGGTYTLIDGYALTTRPQFSVQNSTGVHVERTWSQSKGPGVTDASRRVVGRAVWYAQDGSEQFALIRLDRGKRWSSAVCAYGQPTSIDLTLDDAPTFISIYGQGNDRRTRTQTDLLPQGRFAADWVTKMIPVTSGDWSAPVLSGDNQALGFLGHVAGANGRDAEHMLGPGGWVFRLQPLMQRSGAKLGIKLALERRPQGTAK